MSDDKETMVAGFLFDTARMYVALVRKNRPEWQAGKLNGIGGHVELGETQFDAMVREFREETGAHVADWDFFCTLDSPRWRVLWFKSFCSAAVCSNTDEQVMWYKVRDIVAGNVVGLPDVIPNVRWLLLLALDGETNDAVVMCK